jgi:putative MATE family efflux protein
MSSPIQSSPESLVGRSFWADLRGIFSGEQPDFTTGGIGRAVLLLSIPMVLEMLMQSVFGVVDVFFVGKLGADAVAAVGLTDSLLVLVLAVGMGLSMATTAVVARRIGEKDQREASLAAFQALVAGAAISVPISVVGLLFAPDMLRLMGAAPGVVAAGSGYCQVLFGTNAAILFLFLINAIFRGAGDAVLAMKALWLANLLNIVLDPVLIFGWGPFPEMGVTGAAVATTIGRAVGVGYQVRLLLAGRGRVRLGRGQARLAPEVLRRLLSIAAPGMLQYVIGTASWLALFRILAVSGSEALAGYTIAVRVLVFALLPSWGMGNAAATLVGQNLGAGQPDRAERSVWITAFANMAFLGSVAVLIVVYAEELIRLFTEEATVVGYGVACLQIVSSTYLLLALGFVTMQAFNGAGDTATPTWINVLAYWVLQIPLAYVLAQPLGLGARGVFFAIAVSQAVLALVSVLIFRRGWWKTKYV